MDRVDTPITKPLPYFWSFLLFWKTFDDHMWTKWKFTILLKTSKQRSKKRMNLFKEKKTFRPIYFQISYLPHFLFVLNNLKSYGNTIWSFTNPFWSAKTIKWRPKILSTIMQTGHMCKPTSCHDPLHLKKTYLVHFFINLNDFCCIKCAKWRVIKWFWAPKETKQCTKIYKYFSLKYQHVYPSTCN
jgi:hypothetical protein